MPPVVNPDSVRLAIHGLRYEPLPEDLVWAITKIMVRALFLAGHMTVIVDATNTTRKRRDFWQDDKWYTVFKVFETHPDECLTRAGDDEAIKPVIQRMAEQFEVLQEGENPLEP